MKQKVFENSSQVKAIRYFSGSKTLEIDFVSGKTYQYYEVPESTYESALISESIGKFVNQHVKPVFEYKLIPF